MLGVGEFYLGMLVKSQFYNLYLTKNLFFFYCVVPLYYDKTEW